MTDRDAETSSENWRDLGYNSGHITLRKIVRHWNTLLECVNIQVRVVRFICNFIRTVNFDKRHTNPVLGFDVCERNIMVRSYICQKKEVILSDQYRSLLVKGFLFLIRWNSFSILIIFTEHVVKHLELGNLPLYTYTNKSGYPTIYNQGIFLDLWIYISDDWEIKEWRPTL